MLVDLFVYGLLPTRRVWDGVQVNDWSRNANVSLSAPFQHDRTLTGFESGAVDGITG